ncbi:MAG TPA: hypothetical protein VMC61_07495, partial [Methanocella sp.]|nr:hypothetical protein [Methanocella sp.]
LFSWIFWVPYQFFGLNGGTVGLGLYQVGVLGPLVAAVEMLFLTRGRGGIKSLFQGLLKWSMGAEWYVVALFLPLAIESMALFTIALSGVDLSISRSLAFDGPTFIGQAYYALATTVAIFGFLMPRLLRGYSPLVATIFAAGFAILWRAPLVLANINAGRADYELLWALGNLGTFFIFTWIFRNTRGSLLLLTLFDLSLNYFRWFSRGVMQASPAGDLWGLDFSLHLFVGVIILLAYWKYFLGKAPVTTEAAGATSSG